MFWFSAVRLQGCRVCTACETHPTSAGAVQVCPAVLAQRCEEIMLDEFENQSVCQEIYHGGYRSKRFDFGTAVTRGYVTRDPKTPHQDCRMFMNVFLFNLEAAKRRADFSPSHVVVLRGLLGGRGGDRWSEAVKLARVVSSETGSS